MGTTAHIRKKGQFTIPVEIREKLAIQEDDIVSINLIGTEGFIVVPKKTQTEALLKETATLAKKRGVTIEELLAELDEIRHHS